MYQKGIDRDFFSFLLNYSQSCLAVLVTPPQLESNQQRKRRPPLALALAVWGLILRREGGREKKTKKRLVKFKQHGEKSIILHCYPYCFYYATTVSSKAERIAGGLHLESARKFKSDAKQSSYARFLNYNQHFQPGGSFAYLDSSVSANYTTISYISW